MEVAIWLGDNRPQRPQGVLALPKPRWPRAGAGIAAASGGASSCNYLFSTERTCYCADMVFSPVSQRPLPGGDPLYVPQPEPERLLRRALDLGMNIAVRGEAGTGKTTLTNHVIASAEIAADRVVRIDCHALTVRETLYRLAEGWGWSKPTHSWKPKPGSALAFGGGLMSVTHEQVPIPPDTDRLDGDDIELLSDTIVDRSTTDELDGNDVELPWVAIIEDPSPAAVTAIFGGHRDRLWQLPVQWIVLTRGGISSDAGLFFEAQVTLGDIEVSAAQELLERRLVAAGRQDPTLVNTVIQQVPLRPRDLVAAARDGLLHAEDAPARFRVQGDLTERAAALGRPHAMLMYELLSRGAASASDEALLQRLGYSRARLAQLLAEMRDAGLLVKERDGRKVMFKPAGLDQ